MTTIALVGNPNSGKTTLFNKLTGSSQHVGNWPGVTIEKKVGKIRHNPDLQIVDLPGIYSLSPYSPEEVITRDYLMQECPDALINIIDASHFERNLYLTIQVLELGLPTVLVLNMMDDAAKNGLQIDTSRLSELTGCEVVETVALKNQGVSDIADAVRRAITRRSVRPVRYSAGFEQLLSDIGHAFGNSIPAEQARWYAVKTAENDPAVLEVLPATARPKVETLVAAYEKECKDDRLEITADERYAATEQFGKQVSFRGPALRRSASDRIDRVLTSRVWGLPVFLAVMFGVYYVSITALGGPLTDWVNDTFFGEWAIPGTQSFLESIGVDATVTSLLVDGILSGVGAVLGFLPEVAILFILLTVLEECGYMSRVAFILDRVFRRFGLSGKSFIPLIVSTGCGVPGIMSSRTIESDSERRITVMTTTFMPCSAKLPIIALISGALFGNSAAIALSAYVLGFVMVLLSGIILKKFRQFSGCSAPFVVEMPAYHWPLPSTILHTTGQRSWAFVRKAGTFILLACVAIWFFSSFDTSLKMVEDINDSMLAAFGNAVTAVFLPLGFGQDWEFTVATITGLLAKENVVGTFGTLFGLGENDNLGLWDQVGAMLTPVAGYAFLVFNLICAPCFAAIGAMRRELGSWRDTGKAVLYQCALAYGVGLIVYQFGRFVCYGQYGPGTVAAVLALSVLVYLVAAKDPLKPFRKTEGRPHLAQETVR
ncbi:MAG: ferrous iron transport protein B [Candidatus Methanomethylophilus sp.]|nr:ferrous iron transport protein B [Methanomethylophilus sp.]